jgi:16S rRNA (cytidine1402-2'-O)-methyltransferase
LIRQWYNKLRVLMPGTLFVVATPIGNLEDITARALRVLREVAIIAAEDTRRTANLLARYAITTPATSLHEHNEAQKSASIIARLERGENVALVSDAGTPTISDPGQRLIRSAIDAGLRVESIPGPSAAIAALAASGLPGDTFMFLGFPPPRSKARIEWFERVKAIGGTIVFFEAPHRVRRTLEELQQTVGDCEVVICRELTKVHEELVRGQISEVLRKIPSPIGEFTVVAAVGHTTDLASVKPLEPRAILAEFGEMTNSRKVSRRAAVTALAKQHRVRPNAVYELIERAKKSVE